MPGDKFNHLPKFSDFAKGDNSQLDAVSIQKYVARMIDVSLCLSVCVHMCLCVCVCVCVCVCACACACACACVCPCVCVHIRRCMI